MKVFFSALVSFILLQGCIKTTNCDCAPPLTTTNYKITSRIGGVGGGEAALTEDQKNSVLTISNDGKFKVKNAVTDTEVEGSYTTTLFSSIYGEKTRIVFTPNLPMLPNEYHILTDVQNGKLVFGDNVTDGYSTTFTATP